MHHRRASSSLKAIERPVIAPPLSSSSTSEPRLSPRRMRILLACLGFGVLTLIGLIRSTSSSETSFDPRTYLPSRPYPPLTRIHHNNAYPNDASPAKNAVVESKPQSPPPTPKKKKPTTPPTGKELVFKPDQELGAVIAYLTSLGANAIFPNTMDPADTVPAEMVLEFNTRGPKAETELENLIAETWADNPVVLFTESRTPLSKSVKETFKSYNLLPDPVVFDVDLRDDDPVLTPLMYRLTGLKSLPIVFIGGKPFTADWVASSYKDGQLKKKLEEAGAIINGKKGKHH